jgi:hypothetical protein
MSVMFMLELWLSLYILETENPALPLSAEHMIGPDAPAPTAPAPTMPDEPYVSPLDPWDPDIIFIAHNFVRRNKSCGSAR